MMNPTGQASEHSTGHAGLDRIARVPCPGASGPAGYQ